MKAGALRSGAALIAAGLAWASAASAAEAGGREPPASVAAASAPPLKEGPPTQVWINPGLYSRHFDRDLGLREHNWGIGVEWLPDPHHGLMFGHYHNSNDHLTRYVAYVWRPWVWDWGTGEGGRPRLRTSLGVVVGAFNGYPTMRQGGWFLGALPVVGLEYGRLGMNLSLVPGYRDRLHGALAVQLRLRVW